MLEVSTEWIEKGIKLYQVSSYSRIKTCRHFCWKLRRW